MSKIADLMLMAAGGAGGGGYSGPLGLTASLDGISGQAAGWRTRNVDISLYSGATVRPVFRYISGSSFTGDIQLDNIQIGGNTYSFETSADGFDTDTNNPLTYGSVSWASVGTRTANYGRWIRDSGGTGSNGTGESTAGSGTYYVYAETSSTGSPSVRFWLRGPSIVLPSDPTMSYMEARLGATIGSLDVYLFVTAAP